MVLLAFKHVVFNSALHGSTLYGLSIGGDSSIHFREEESEDSLPIFPVQVVKIHFISIRFALILLLGSLVEVSAFSQTHSLLFLLSLDLLPDFLFNLL